MSSIFKKAKRSRRKLKLALVGPSGSGKTMGALRLLRGLGCKKIAVIDTENGSSELYSDFVVRDAKKEGPFIFDVAIMEAPFLVTKYLRAMKEAVEEGYDGVIVDSMTHAWAGEGGILSRKEALDQRGGNSFTNWGKLTPEQEALKNAVLTHPTHLVCTMRTKTEYIVEQNDKGKSAPRKVGLAPIQREGFEYEFDVVFEVAMDHNASASKDRTDMFDGVFFKINEETGRQLNGWLTSSTDEDTTQPAKNNLEDNPPPKQQTTPQMISLDSMDRAQLSSSILTYAQDIGWKVKQIEDASNFLFKKKTTELSDEDMRELHNYIVEQYNR